MVGQAVALDRPTLRAADGDHRRVLARAVVVDRLRRTAWLEPAFELALVPAGVAEERPDGLDVNRRSEVRRGGDREVVLVEVLARAREEQCLDRLGRRAQRRAQARIAGRRDDPSALDGDRVHVVDGLDDLAAPDGYAERLSHGRTVNA